MTPTAGEKTPEKTSCCSSPDRSASTNPVVRAVNGKTLLREDEFGTIPIIGRHDLSLFSPTPSMRPRKRWIPTSSSPAVAHIPSEARHELGSGQRLLRASATLPSARQLSLSRRWPTSGKNSRTFGRGAPGDSDQRFQDGYAVRLHYRRSALAIQARDAGSGVDRRQDHRTRENVLHGRMSPKAQYSSPETLILNFPPCPKVRLPLTLKLAIACSAITAD